MQILKNTFLKNVAFLFGGNSVAIILGFLMTPLIARIYGPASYGVFAIFMSIVTVVQPVTTLQFPASFAATTSERDFYALVRISLISVAIWIAVGLVSALVVLMLNDQLFYTYLIPFIPLYILLASFFAIVRSCSVRFQTFGRAAVAKSVATLTGKTTTIAFGLLSHIGAIGLLTGNLIMYLTESLSLFSVQTKKTLAVVLTSKFSRTELSTAFQEHIQYPKFIMPNILLTNLASQLPVFLLTYFSSQQNVGIYSISMSLVAVPSNLISTSLGSVFLPRFTKINSGVRKGKIILSFYKGLTQKSILIFPIYAVVLFVVVPIVLGESWTSAAEVSAIISISYFLSVVSGSLLVTFRLSNLEASNLTITSLAIFLKTGFFIAGYQLLGFQGAIIGYFTANLIQNIALVAILFVKYKLNLYFLVRDVGIGTFLYLGGLILILRF